MLPVLLAPSLTFPAMRSLRAPDWAVACGELSPPHRLPVPAASLASREVLVCFPFEKPTAAHELAEILTWTMLCRMSSPKHSHVLCTECSSLTKNGTWRRPTSPWLGSAWLHSTNYIALALISSSIRRPEEEVLEYSVRSTLRTYTSTSTYTSKCTSIKQSRYPRVVMMIVVMLTISDSQSNCGSCITFWSIGIAQIGGSH